MCSRERDGRAERVGHLPLGRQVVGEPVHPAPQRGVRRLLGQDLARAGAQPGQLGMVNRFDQRLTRREVAVQRADAHAGLTRDRLQRHLVAARGERPARRRQQPLPVAVRIRAHRPRRIKRRILRFCYRLFR